VPLSRSYVLHQAVVPLDDDEVAARSGEVHRGLVIVRSRLVRAPTAPRRRPSPTRGLRNHRGAVAGDVVADEADPSPRLDDEGVVAAVGERRRPRREVGGGACGTVAYASALGHGGR
jgi:hypothetical protein